MPVTAEDLGDRLKDYQPGSKIQITVFHQEQLRTVEAVLTQPRPTTYNIVPIQNPTATQQNNLKGWLGSSVSQLKG